MLARVKQRPGTPPALERRRDVRASVGRKISFQLHAEETVIMVFIVLWLLGVPLGLIILLWLLGVFS